MIFEFDMDSISKLFYNETEMPFESTSAFIQQQEVSKMKKIKERNTEGGNSSNTSRHILYGCRNQEQIKSSFHY